MKLSSYVLLAILLATGCNDHRPNVSGTGARGSGTAADNTAVNQRDRSDAAKTPIDQNENQKDVGITAEIRSRVVKTATSTDAHNVKIITQDGRVTLRGPVKNADEKKVIEDIAREVAGKDHVDSHLEVAP